MTSLDEHIERVLPEVIALRRELHTHPELSRQEHETSRRVREALGRLPNIRVLPPLTGTDVIAILNPDRDGPCIALRADMDALPIQEANDLPYRSQVPGVMHACGHDGHTANLVGTAMVLSAIADELPGKVKFIFQPDEEDHGGGRLLCEAGVLESPRVDAAVALHAWPGHRVGTVAIRPGPMMGANATFDAVIHGRSGHGAYPHRTIDPIVASAHIITALQTIASRAVDPLDAVVVTVGRIHAGSATNIIPEECRFAGTLRYLRPDTGELVRRRVREIIEQTALALGTIAEVRVEEGYPSTINDPALTELVVRTATDLFGPDDVVTELPISLGVEDFSFYGQRVPAAMFRLGIRPEHMDTHPGLHNDRFNFNDAALPIGMGMFCEVVRRFLHNGGK